jgi:hypothetical protein
MGGLAQFGRLNIGVPAWYALELMRTQKIGSDDRQQSIAR